MPNLVNKTRILVVDDEELYFNVVDGLLPSERFQVSWASDRDHALEEMASRTADLIILDLRLSQRSDDASGLDLLRELRHRWHDVQVIVFTSFYMQPDMVVRCVKEGAYYYFTKDRFRTDPDSFVRLVSEALAYHPQYDILEDRYPHPLALVYRDYKRNVVAAQLKFRRLIELVELLVKLSALVCLVARAEDLPHSEISLGRPSLGRWFEFLEFAIKEKTSNIWIDNIRQIFSAKRRKTVADLIHLRNEMIGHGATRPEHEYNQIVKKRNASVIELLRSANVFAAWHIFVVKSTRLLSIGRYLHTIINIKGHNPKLLAEELELKSNCEADKVYLYDSEREELLCLHPFVAVFVCEQCNQETVFIYEKIDRGEVLYLDYANGHHSSSIENYRSTKLLLRE